MNLIDIYPCTSQRLYFFQPIENQQNNSYNVAIYKWSDSQKKHIFEDHLSPQTYIEMLGEPDMLFGALFNDDNSKQNRNLMDILIKNNIKTQGQTIENPYHYDQMKASIQFPNKYEANKCVNLMQRTFKYASP